ncbi:HpcH/HpaI aldolase/citrate lyase family protein [Arthrobacter sp. H14-L1]|uniref:HpcH/HpaI aldolase/citrate lyase family protein n=1 Tax=Arthrobacter sp. H14-L1 TaxID=2996697 RepID=UPI002271AFC9|nr:CoA ester lyase [Arthrobacter sp. H14-L1]MCY0904662.1 CoA ester lyase [Arthrobacter sp. H14-L1]
MTFTMGPALLFCPADRPERYDKAADRADAVILDLEDAVAPVDKPAARRHLIDNQQDPGRTIVRVNPLGTPEADADLAALRQTQYRTVMVAKAEDARALSGLVGYDLIALCETALGVLEAPRLAQVPNVVALMWGAEDLVASLGGASSRKDDGGYRAVAVHARSSVLLAAGAYGKTAIDAVYVDIPDLAGLAAEARDAVASGFGSTACIHPGQVAVIRDAYTPAAEDVASAQELLAAAAASGSGVFAYKGKMIDGPILKHARQTLRRAGLQ